MSPADATTGDVLAAYGEVVADLGRVVARARASVFSVRKEAANALRDRLTVGLVGKIRPSEYAAAPAELAAARELIPLLDQRPASFQRLSFEENTTELGLLLTDLATPAATAALGTLGLAAWTADLRRAHDDFKALMLEAAAAEGADPTVPRLLTVQLRLNTKLRLLLGILEHFNERDTAPYPALMEACYDRIVAVRAVSRRRESAEPEQPPAP